MIQLTHIYDKAKNVIEKMHVFSFGEFENVFFGTQNANSDDLFSLYDQTIFKLRKEDRHGSADSYQCSVNSLKAFIEYVKAKLPDFFPFEDITPEFLNDYERFIMNVKKLSRTTVGVYTRQLRAIFNLAIEKGMTQNYPFGKRKYRTPGTVKVKKALSLDELKILANAKTTKQEQEIARDFWLLSFCLYGINMKDLALIRNKNLTEKHLTFYRSKTFNTSKANWKPISVPLTEKSIKIINKYRQPDLNPDSYTFRIVNQNDNSFQARRKIQYFTRFINQHIKTLALSIGLPSLSYQWARHTFATLSVRQGESMEFVNEALGHSNLKTTQNYFFGFDDDTRKNIMVRLTDF